MLNMQSKKTKRGVTIVILVIVAAFLVTTVASSLFI